MTVLQSDPICKTRISYYCNLKLVLLALVCWGHLVEPYLAQVPALYHAYRLVYLVHMPAFVFLTGLFMKNAAACKAQLRRAAALYGAAQGLCCLWLALTGKTWPPLTPVWYLWYLQALLWWSLFGWLWHARPGLGRVLLGVALGLAVWGGLGRSLALGRTVAFFPWLVLGMGCPLHFPWRRLRPLGLVGLAAAGAAYAAVSPRIPTALLYRADPGQPLALRLACMAMALGLGLFLFGWVPTRRLPCSKAGADTMLAYLLHGGPVAALRLVGLLMPLQAFAAVSLWLAAFSVWLLYKAGQWHSQLYFIVPSA